MTGGRLQGRGIVVGERRRKITTVIGYAMVIVVLLIAAIGPVMAPYDPGSPVPDGSRFEPPTLRHPFGTDSIGLDIFSRVLAAVQVDVVIALVGTALALVFGITLGTIVGYYGRVLDSVVMRVADLSQAIPVFVLALLLVASLGQGIVSVIYAIAFVDAPLYLRLTRTEVRSLRGRAFVEAAIAGGFSQGHVLFRHVLPNAWHPAIVQSSVQIGFAIFLAAGLSFIGAGVRPPTAELGAMISSGAELMIVGAWWTSVFPGLAMVLCVLSFAVLGDSLRHRLDPTRR